MSYWQWGQRAGIRNMRRQSVERRTQMMDVIMTLPLEFTRCRVFWNHCWHRGCWNIALLGWWLGFAIDHGPRSTVIDSWMMIDRFLHRTSLINSWPGIRNHSKHLRRAARRCFRKVWFAAVALSLEQRLQKISGFTWCRTRCGYLMSRQSHDSDWSWTPLVPLSGIDGYLRLVSCQVSWVSCDMCSVVRTV